jgi:hypothetical protein
VVILPWSGLDSHKGWTAIGGPRHLVRAGRTTTEIAAQLGISAKTVDHHQQRAFLKLGVRTQTHAVAVALRLGLIRPEPVTGSPGGAAAGPAVPARPVPASPLADSKLILRSLDGFGYARRPRDIYGAVLPGCGRGRSRHS